MMITEQALYGIKHYIYGEAYYGSDEGMRFRVAREPLKNVVYASEEERNADEPRLRAEVWFGKLSYEKTPKEEMEQKDFDFDKEGYSAAVNWLNEMKSKAGKIQYFSRS
ncbi:MAG: hypothetical protein IJV16_02860 [Lachnospiraceae bacterium]|nr:hypothetical protein [Lachnospiraceae bacterium]